jgi:hypothetical protein
VCGFGVRRVLHPEVGQGRDPHVFRLTPEASRYKLAPTRSDDEGCCRGVSRP